MWRSMVATILAAGLAATAAGAGDLQVNGKLISTVSQGSPPLQVTSTTAVANLNADLLDGLEAAAFRRKLHNVVTVSASGGDYTSIQAAIDSITDADFDNAYVVFVGPGTYSERVTLKDWVTLVGAGRFDTHIESAGSSVFGLAPTVAAATGAGLYHLSVENTGGFDYAVAYSVGAVNAGPVVDVSLFAHGATASSIALDNGALFSLFVVASEAVASASGAGSTTAVAIRNSSSGLYLDRSEVRAGDASTSNMAIQNTASSSSYVVTVSHSKLKASTADISSDAEFTTYVSFSELGSGGVVPNGGTVKCAMIVDFALTPTAYTDTCP